MLVGFLIVPTAAALLGRASGWSLGVFFLAVLASLRLAPAVARRLLPLSSETLDICKARRHMAKRYDSYQWRKLFWIGIGLTAYLVAYGRFGTGPVVLASTCLALGAAGMVTWHTMRGVGV